MAQSEDFKDIIPEKDLKELKAAMRYLIKNQYPTFSGQSRNSKLIYDYSVEHDLDHGKLSSFLHNEIS